MDPTSASERSRFVLGMNLPWSARAATRPSGERPSRCGWDFGPGPPGFWDASRDPLPRAWDETRDDLARLSALGVRDVRFFVLAHGVNYPVGEPLARYGEVRSGDGLPPRFVPLPGLRPPALPSSFLRDFAGLLAIVRALGMRLWPVLLGFELFEPLLLEPRGATSRGRSAFVLGHDGGEDAIERFYDATLAPLLAVARETPEAVGAFEVMNEPDWVVRRGVLRRVGHVAAPVMRRLLLRGVRRIVDAGFVATIGFLDPSPPWLDRRTRAELARLARAGAYVHQLHHYPSATRPRRLPRHDELPIRPCIVGELPSARGTSAPSDHMRWEDAGLAEDDPARYLHARLALVRRAGYPGAFVWALHARDGATDWGDRQAEQLRAFASSLDDERGVPASGGWIFGKAP